MYLTSGPFHQHLLLPPWSRPCSSSPGLSLPSSPLLACKSIPINSSDLQTKIRSHYIFSLVSHFLQSENQSYYKAFLYIMSPHHLPSLTLSFFIFCYTNSLTFSLKEGTACLRSSAWTATHSLVIYRTQSFPLPSFCLNVILSMILTLPPEISAFSIVLQSTSQILMCNSL